jgi:chemotaxis protein methyltransferase CheR
MTLTVQQARDDARSGTFCYGDYLRFGNLVHVRFGLHFTERRCADLERGVLHAFAASTCVDLDAYYDLLQDEEKGAVERERLINALTVGETHFFRNESQFDALYYHVLPQIIERKRALRTLRIWSAGCASGEEPYSIAVMLRELLSDVDEWSITILGSDVNTESLDRARKAIYGNWAFREDRAKRWRTRYFRPLDKRHELIPEVRNMVTFTRLNLAEDSYPAYETNTTWMDLILCRNVTIYFNEFITRQVIGRFYDALVDRGWLVIGHSEHTLGTYRRFQARTFSGAILYQRTGQPTVWPKEWGWLAASPSEKNEAWENRDGLQGLDKRDSDRLITHALSREVSAKSGDHPENAVSDPPKEMAEDPVEQAREWLEYGHSEQARELLLKVIAQQPDRALTCVLLGRSCANLGYWEEAKGWCTQAVCLDKLALEAYYTLALVFQHCGALDAALDAMKKVVYIDRTNVLGHFGLADLYRRKGQFPQALKSLDNARRLLSAHADEAFISGSGGTTAGRLREAVIRRQQQWGAEASRGGI